MALLPACAHDARRGCGSVRRVVHLGKHPMRYLFALAVLIAGLSPAAASKWDLSTMSCQQFVTSDKDTIALILTWLDAYYRGRGRPAGDRHRQVRQECRETRRLLRGQPAARPHHRGRQGVRRVRRRRAPAAPALRPARARRRARWINGRRPAIKDRLRNAHLERPAMKRTP